MVFWFFDLVTTSPSCWNLCLVLWTYSWLLLLLPLLYHFCILFMFCSWVDWWIKVVGGLAGGRLTQGAWPWGLETLTMEHCLSESVSPPLVFILDSVTLSGERAPFAAPKLCNELPLHIKQATLLSVLETHLFSLAFNSAEGIDFVCVCDFFIYSFNR